MMRAALLFLGAAILFVIIATVIRMRRPGGEAARAQTQGHAREAHEAPLTGFREDFSSPSLDRARWIPFSEGDFKEQVIDVVEVPGANPRDYRLRLRASTLGTTPETAKTFGVRSAPLLRIGADTRISAEIDWNHQENGSYLSAALILCPLATSGNPLQGPDWLKLEYVGVPPGKNGRMVVVSRTAGRERYWYLEGWPQQHREGRLLSLQHLELTLSGAGFQVKENGSVVYENRERPIAFPDAYLYLQMSSHSNYPSRQVYFDNIRWQFGPEDR
jgi:hypothetical protein